MGIVGVGVKDIIQDTALTSGFDSIQNRFIDNIIGKLPSTNINVIQMDNSSTSLFDWYEDRFQYNSGYIFTDSTKLSLSFWSKITEHN